MDLFTSCTVLMCLTFSSDPCVLPLACISWLSDNKVLKPIFVMESCPFSFDCNGCCCLLSQSQLTSVDSPKLQNKYNLFWLSQTSLKKKKALILQGISFLGLCKFSLMFLKNIFCAFDLRLFSSFNTYNSQVFVMSQSLCALFMNCLFICDFCSIILCTNFCPSTQYLMLSSGVGLYLLC